MAHGRAPTTEAGDDVDEQHDPVRDLLYALREVCDHEFISHEQFDFYRRCLGQIEYAINVGRMLYEMNAILMPEPD